jgi:hypothetical protein
MTRIPLVVTHGEALTLELKKGGSGIRERVAGETKSRRRTPRASRSRWLRPRSEDGVRTE